MKKEFYIFFSWQSDVKGNIRYIDKKIKDAVIEITAMPEMEGCTIKYDHSTQNRSGSPGIVDTVHEKINKCDVFIGDVTPITIIEGKNDNSEKLIPNPNVMAESGFALRAVGENRIILLMKANTGKIGELPFDIRHRRINSFNIEDKPKLNLTAFIFEALMYSRKFYENAYEQNVISHDSKIYETLKSLIISEQIFMDTNEYIVNNQRISKWGYKYFDCIEEFLKQDENAFLISELQHKSNQLKDAIHNLVLYTASRFSPMKSCWEVDPEVNLTPEQKEEAEKNSYYSWIDKGAGEVMPWVKYDKLSDEIIENLSARYQEIIKSYREFRQAIRENLFL
ncbi:MAG: hypothetical protein KIC84_16695 [Dysgonomonas mossii]|uniref:hypothetical protein n=1 Tax=Dysgonomonas mossii TaxID=163665 RepID=UPI0026F0A28F|nr:hypothetical protein [Dysgonomonas mossii]MBS5908847.1 hypothetical protein [Dysgonomonas mossii]